MSQKCNEHCFYIVDRIENNIVALEDENREIIFEKIDNINTIPAEGDVLRKIDSNYIVDIEETKKRKDKVKELMKGLWAD